VLIPTYNHARFLAEALKSVREQDFTHWELIISDDASTDNSEAVLREFALTDARVRFTLQPTNLGLVGNFNWCLSQARGDYIKFLLADDKFARPDALRRLVAMLDGSQETVLASSAAQIINEKTEPQGVRDYFGQTFSEDGRATCRRCLVQGSNQVGEPSLVLFRRQCAVGGFNPAYRHWVDAELAFRILEQGRFAYCAEPLTAFRVHASQQTRRDQEQQLHLTEFYRLLLEFADRPWFSRAAARARLFEELYQNRKRANLPVATREALAQALDSLGGQQGYMTFLLRRRLHRPFQNLRRSLAKRLC
jgi:glycosyltransferase involved in cell wall biosynthesis